MSAAIDASNAQARAGTEAQKKRRDANRKAAGRAWNEARAATGRPGRGGDSRLPTTPRRTSSTPGKGTAGGAPKGSASGDKPGRTGAAAQRTGGQPAKRPETSKRRQPPGGGRGRGGRR
ncbi:hypothetical protein GCM10027440_26290 [Nocardiopsis coralliicola]